MSIYKIMFDNQRDHISTTIQGGCLCNAKIATLLVLGVSPRITYTRYTITPQLFSGIKSL